MKDIEFDYKHFFDLSPDLLCIAGFDGYFKRINPAVSKALGYTEEELYSRPINDFVYKEDRQATSNARRDLINSVPLYNFENRYQTKSGGIIWLAWTSYPVISDELVFAIAKDITYKKQLESERQALLESLTNTNTELKQLSLNTSHDLRSPLNGLLLIFDLLDTSKITDRESLELIQLLKLASENLKKKLNNYVDVLSEKLEEQTEAVEVNLNSCLESVLESINLIIETSGATIQSDFSEVNTVKFTMRGMESIFLNLITNAVKYAKSDIPPKITIHTEDHGESVRLIFTDNGLGFDMEKVEDKIFSMHSSFHNHHDSKGIGLYLVHSHVKGMGGKISVESKVDAGTKFIITLKK